MPRFTGSSYSSLKGTVERQESQEDAPESEEHGSNLLVALGTHEIAIIVAAAFIHDVRTISDLASSQSIHDEAARLDEGDAIRSLNLLTTVIALLDSEHSHIIILLAEAHNATVRRGEVSDSGVGSDAGTDVGETHGVCSLVRSSICLLNQCQYP